MQSPTPVVVSHALQKPALHLGLIKTQSPAPVLVLQLLQLFGLPEHEFEFGQSFLSLHDFAAYIALEFGH
jgi:hypothetical protein